MPSAERDLTHGERAAAAARDGRPHVVIIGGGFGGLYAAKGLRDADVRLTLVDRWNHHLFQPLLYQVAIAGLAATDIASPIRKILRRQSNATVLLGEVTAVDAARRRIELADGELSYDYLVVAAGATNSYFGNERWEQHAPGLKSLDDALEIRRRVLLAYEAAERAREPEERRCRLNFVVIGGGPTGVELAGALAEIAHHTLAREFRNFDPRDTRVILLEGGSRLLSAYPDELSQRAVEQLEDLGVEVRTEAMVSAIDARGVEVGGEERIDAATVLWAAGIRGAPLAGSLPAKLDRQGRVHVEQNLTLPGDERIHVIGDLARVQQDGGLVPGVAPAAIQMGRHAAKNIVRQIERRPLLPFRYVDKGSLATIGRSRAVGVIRRLRISGLIAWLLWLFVHIFFLIGFRNRVVVLLEWAWAYISFQRSARVIVGLSSSGRRAPASSSEE